MKKLLIALSLCLLPGLLPAQLYKDKTAPVESRVADLIGRMTPEEKFWQMFMIPGDLGIGKDKLKQGIFGFQISAEGKTADATGQLLTYAPGASAAETAIRINEIQRFFLTESRLGIPIIPFDEALHGLVRHKRAAFIGYADKIPAIRCCCNGLRIASYSQLDKLTAVAGNLLARGNTGVNSYLGNALVDCFD